MDDTAEIFELFSDGGPLASRVPPAVTTATEYVTSTAESPEVSPSVPRHYFRATGMDGGTRLAAFTRSIREQVPEAAELLVDEVPRSGATPSAVVVPGWRTYTVERLVQLSGDAVESAQVQINEGDGTPLLRLQFTPQGREAFEALTVQLQHRRVAIVFDCRLLTVANVTGPIRGGFLAVSRGPDPSARARFEQISAALPAHNRGVAGSHAQ